jgi:hypothetical protein
MPCFLAGKPGPSAAPGTVRFVLLSTTQGRRPVMPVILWLLGVPLTLVIVLLLVGAI